MKFLRSSEIQCIFRRSASDSIPKISNQQNEIQNKPPRPLLRETRKFFSESLDCRRVVIQSPETRIDLEVFANVSPYVFVYRFVDRSVSGAGVQPETLRLSGFRCNNMTKFMFQGNDTVTRLLDRTLFIFKSSLKLKLKCYLSRNTRDIILSQADTRPAPSRRPSGGAVPRLTVKFETSITYRDCGRCSPPGRTQQHWHWQARKPPAPRAKLSRRP